MKKSQNKKSYFCLLYEEEEEFKGSISIGLNDGDSVEIVRSNETVRFVRLAQINFLDRIREKLQAD